MNKKTQSQLSQLYQWVPEPKGAADFWKEMDEFDRYFGHVFTFYILNSLLWKESDSQRQNHRALMGPLLFLVSNLNTRTSSEMDVSLL